MKTVGGKVYPHPVRLMALLNDLAGERGRRRVFEVLMTIGCKTLWRSMERSAARNRRAAKRYDVSSSCNNSGLTAVAPKDDHRLTMDWRDHITVDPNVRHGRPCITGTRVMVTVVLDNLAAGLSAAEIAESYPSVSPDSVRAVLQYAAELAKERVVPLGA